MYVTIKLEGNVGEIHSIKVDGEEIEPEFAYTVAPHRFLYSSGYMKLREAEDEVLKRKKAKERERGQKRVLR